MGGRARADGIALVSVLWVLTLLSVVVAGVTRVARSDSRGAAGALALSQARYAGAGAVDLAVAKLLAPMPARWSADGQWRDVTIAGVALQIAVIDESGKIDLNAAPPTSVERLLAAAGVDDARAAALVDAIMDWRDADAMRRLNGAERDEYRAAGLGYVARNGAFTSLDELRLVLGMDSELFARLAPALTVHGGRAAVDLTVAPLLVQQALGGVGQAVADRANESTVFSISVRTAANHAVNVRLLAIVELTAGRGTTPYRVLAWQEPRAVVDAASAPASGGDHG